VYIALDPERTKNQFFRKNASPTVDLKFKRVNRDKIGEALGRSVQVPGEQGKGVHAGLVGPIAERAGELIRRHVEDSSEIGERGRLTVKSVHYSKHNHVGSRQGNVAVFLKSNPQALKDSAVLTVHLRFCHGDSLFSRLGLLSHY
jgi:hypothetical protein